MKKYMTTSEVAELFEVSPRTVEGWRHRQQGPPFIKLGGGIKYERPAVIAWMDGQRVGGE